MTEEKTASPVIENQETGRIEEELISQASAGVVKLPMLDIIFSRMAVSLVSSFKTKAGILCDISFNQVEYATWDDVVESTDRFGICAVAEARPWGGTLSAVLDSDLIFAALETQMGGMPRPGSRPRSADLHD